MRRRRRRRPHAERRRARGQIVRNAARLDSDGMSLFRRRARTRWPPPEVEGIAAAAALARRACSGASRRCSLRAREAKLRDLGGLVVEMYRRGAFREDLLEERCADAVGIDARLAEIDDLLHGERHAPRCELRRADPARLALLPELRPRARRRRRERRPRTRTSAAAGRRQARGRDRAPPSGRARAAAPPRTPRPGLLRRVRPAPAGRSAARSPSLRRGWLRRFGWYPGDWIWVGAADARSSPSPARRSRSR